MLKATANTWSPNEYITLKGKIAFSVILTWVHHCLPESTLLPLLPLTVVSCLKG